MRRILISVLLSLTIGVSAMGMVVNDVNLKDEISQNNKKIELNGAGIRTKYFLKLYVGSLYLHNQTSNGQDIVNSKETMAIKLNITSKMITTERLKDALKEGFETVEPAKLKRIEKDVEKFDSVFTDKVNLGDIYSFEAENGVVEVKRNGKLLTVIKSQEFKEALFGIWLGKNAIDKNLKKKMLGE